MEEEKLVQDEEYEEKEAEQLEEAHRGSCDADQTL